jgi:hypothetical protein
MNRLIYLLFIAIFIVEFLYSTLGIIPRAATWLPEILAVFACILVSLKSAASGKIYISKIYIYLILLYLTTMFASIAFNGTGLFHTFVGARVHLKYIPFFLLPMVYRVSDKEFKQQLTFILFLLLFQLPVSLVQRMYYSKIGLFTGDVVGGTLLYSGTLSITLVCSIAVVFSLYLKKQITKKYLLLISFWLFLPTTLNETKITVFLLPIALLIPALFCEGYLNPGKTRKLLTGCLISLLLLLLFIPIYDYTRKPLVSTGGAPDFLGIFQKEGYLQRYFFRNTVFKPGQHVFRGDAIVLTYKELAKHPARLIFGSGPGASFKSYLDSREVTTESDQLRYRTSILTITVLTWEIGLLGLGVYLAFFVFLYGDARLVSKSGGWLGSFALGWRAVIIIVALSSIYINTLDANVISFLFWYFTGLIAARAIKLRVAQQNCQASQSLRMRRSSQERWYFSSCLEPRDSPTTPGNG